MIKKHWFSNVLRFNVVKIAIVLIAIAGIATIGIVGCGGDDDVTGPSPDITCSARAMSWGIVYESGPTSTSQSCDRVYGISRYKETCEGTRTYTTSGNTYSFTAVYNYMTCDIDVTVDGIGSCHNEDTSC